MAQRFPSWELIVVHDGDNEDIRAAMQRYVSQDPRIRYLHRPMATNIANAYNFGITHSEADYIAILDDDDCWVDPDKLAVQVAFLDSHPDYAACGGGMIVVDAHGQKLMQYLKWEHDRDIKRWALVANPLAHSTTMFRRQVGGQIAAYDESLAGFQDWDLWLKLGRVGRLYNFQRVFTSYTIWEGGGSFEQQRANARSAITIVRRHHDAYGGVALALPLSWLQWVYAHLPTYIRQHSFSRLSRLKKAIFGNRPGNTTDSGSVRPAA
jgi:glycosyltransferase involved in cell wall biosynthesis